MIIRKSLSVNFVWNFFMGGCLFSDDWRLISVSKGLFPYFLFSFVDTQIKIRNPNVNRQIHE